MRRVHREVRAPVSLRGVLGTDTISDLVEREMWMAGVGKDVDFKRKICLKTCSPSQRASASIYFPFIYGYFKFHTILTVLVTQSPPNQPSR